MKIELDTISSAPLITRVQGWGGANRALRWLHFAIAFSLKYQNFENSIFDFLKSWNFRFCKKIRILKLSDFNIALKYFHLWSAKKQISKFNHRKRRHTVRYTYPKIIPSNFHAERSILKIDKFLDLRKFSLPDPGFGYPRVISSSLAPRSRRRPEWLEGPRQRSPMTKHMSQHVPSAPWW